MYTRRQANLIYAGILVLAAFAMMTSCSEHQASAAPIHGVDAPAPSAPYIAPYMPAGECRIAYAIEQGGTLFERCTLALPAGIDANRISVLATVSSGAFTVDAWLVNTFVIREGTAPGSINASFQLRNVGSKADASTATVTIAIAQTMTPTAATVGVE